VEVLPPRITEELVEQLAESLYNALDPRFRDFPWPHVTDGTRKWALDRAQQVAPIVIQQATVIAQQLLLAAERSEHVAA
jgi:hypothetical protein